MSRTSPDSSPPSDRSPQPPGLPPAARGFFLALGMIVVLLAVSPLAYWLKGPLGVAAAAVAALVCFVSTLLSLLVELRRRDDAPLAALMLGMFYRMGLPIAAVLVIKLRSQALWEAGAAVYLLVFFLVGLAARTLLTLPPAEN